MGTFSKIPKHEVIRDIWKGDPSMAHLSLLGYPLLKFFMEHYGFNILTLEKDKEKKRMRYLLPLVWVIRLYGFLASSKRRENYRLNETMKNEIIMGGNTLIIISKKIRTSQNLD